MNTTSTSGKARSTAPAPPTPPQPSSRHYSIGSLAKAAGVGVETIRYYQRRGLLAQPERQEGAYRRYADSDLERLRAIRRAQQLGFSLDEIASLLALNADQDRLRARQQAQEKLELIDANIRQLQQMRSALAELVDCCTQGDPTAPCPILRALLAQDDH